METKPKRKEGIKQREVGGEKMLYDVGGRSVHVLNRTADFVWQRCDGSHALDDLVAEAVGIYEVPEQQARAEIATCLATLRERGVIE